MTVEDVIRFRKSGTSPDNIPPLIKALLHDASGDWDSAHNIAQDIQSMDGSWVHAYLHRKEGDKWNANYWYKRCNKPFPDYSLEEEWMKLVNALI
jgi:hypothetical protein